MAVYPADLPAPLMASYSVSKGNTSIRTDMDSGYARVRQRYQRAPSTANVKWLFNEAQMATFRAFYKDDIFGGAAWFDVDLNVGNGLQTYQARFVGPWSAEYVSGMAWSVTAALEVDDA